MVEFCSDPSTYPDNGKVMHVFMDSVAIDSMLSKMAERYGAVERGRYMLLTDLIKEIAGLQDAVIIDERVRKLLLLRVLRVAEEQTGIRVEKGFEDLFLGEVEELIPEYINDSSPVERALRYCSEGRLILSLLSSYTEMMEKLALEGQYDRYSAAKKAIEAAEAVASTGIEKIVFWEPVHIDSLAASLMRELAKQKVVALVFAPVRERALVEIVSEKTNAIVQEAEQLNESSFEFFGAPDRRREVEEVARRICQLLSSGVRDEEIVVACSDIEQYLNEIQCVFKEYSIPSRMPAARHRYSRAGSYLRAFLSLLDETLNSQELLAFLSHDYLGLGRDELYLFRTRMETVRSDITDYLEYLEDWQKGTETGKVLKEIRRIRSLAGKAESERDWTKVIEIAYKLIRRGFRDHGEPDQIVSIFSSIITSLQSKPLGSMAKTEFIELCELCLNERWREGAAAGVVVTDAGLVYSHFNHLFLLGADQNMQIAADYFPQYLTLPVLEELAKAGIRLPISDAERTAAERYRFQRLFSKAQKLTFSYTSSGTEGEELLPSFELLERLKEGKDGKEVIEEVNTHRIERDEFWPEAQELFGPDFDRALCETGEYGDSEFTERVSVAKSIESGGGHEWHVDGELNEILKNRKLSASDLNEYSKCPFRCLASRILGLSPPVRFYDPLTLGNSVHRALLELFRNFSPIELADMNEQERRRQVSMVIDRILPGFAMQNWDYSVLRWLAENSILGFLRADEGRVRELKPAIRQLEYPFGREGDFRIGDFSFQGKMDRVEECAEGLVVIDYKTGSENCLRRYFPSKKGHVGDYEIPLYSLFLQAEGKVIGGLYYRVDARMSGKFVAGFWDKSAAPSAFLQMDGPPVLLDSGELAELMETYRSNVLYLAGKVTGGIFELSPRKNECRTCGYRLLCRYRGQ